MTADRTISRRSFLQIGGASLLAPLPQPSTAPLRMGVIADLHHGLDPHALDRLEVFLGAVAARQPDCVLQLGDFTYGTADSVECLRLWEQFSGPRYHVLGNHDLDFTTKQRMIDLWSMPGPYYSFDRGGYHVVVLDRNNLRTSEGTVPYAVGNYFVDAALRGHADAAQLEWLRADLAATSLPTVVFVHQPLGRPRRSTSPGDPGAAIESAFEEANRVAGRTKVIACFCGHNHLDRHYFVRGIHYVWLNSASYYWLGDRQHPTYETRYGPMAAYRDALFAFLTFHGDGSIAIEGRQSAWVPPSPRERGYAGSEQLTPRLAEAPAARRCGTHPGDRGRSGVTGRARDPAPHASGRRTDPAEGCQGASTNAPGRCPRISIGLAALTLLASAITGSAQPRRFVDRVDVTRILIDVRVVDGRWNPVRDLGTEDFLVRIGGQSAPVDSVQWIGGPDLDPALGQDPTVPHMTTTDSPPPGRLIVLFFQKSLDRERIRGLLRMLVELRSFLAELAPSDRVAVLSFDSRLKIWLDFTSDVDAVRAVLARRLLFEAPGRIEPAGAPSLLAQLDLERVARTYSVERALEVLGRALEHLPGVKTVVLIGHGFGQLTRMGVAMVNRFEDASDALQRARASVFSLDVTEADYHTLEEGLRLVADETGGFFERTHLFARRPLERLAGAIAGHYALFVEKPDLSRGTHPIDVELTRRPGTVLARRSFVNEQPVDLPDPPGRDGGTR